MKRTEIERWNREVKRARKKNEVLGRKGAKSGSNVLGDYIEQLAGLFFHDQCKIYNINHSIEILEFLENMKSSLPEDKWETVIRKAVRKTGVEEKDSALVAIKELMG